MTSNNWVGTKTVSKRAVSLKSKLDRRLELQNGTERADPGKITLIFNTKSILRRLTSKIMEKIGSPEPVLLGLVQGHQILHEKIQNSEGGEGCKARLWNPGTFWKRVQSEGTLSLKR
jgi:hypothetical protein